jgi:hypothetical protein
VVPPAGAPTIFAPSARESQIFRSSAETSKRDS